jgi:hypothetical protein
MGSAPSDHRRRHHLTRALVLAVSGCAVGPPLQIQQAVPQPAVAFVPDTPWHWPIWPTADGRLIGGSGFVTGIVGPTAVTPGLGLGALLLPSILGGRHLSLPGPIPSWRPVLPPQIVWEPAAGESDRAAGVSSDQGATAAAAAGDEWRWSKAGLTPIGPQRRLPLPEAPYLTEPWGPVTGEPGPWPSGKPLLDLGFPTADGTPVVTPFITWFQLSGDRFRITLLDVVGGQVFTPPSILANKLNLPMAVDPPSLLIGPFATEGRLRLVDLLTGGIDPLPELPPINSTAIFAGATMSQRASLIAYATVAGGPAGSQAATPGQVASQVQLFDRRTRMIDRLQKLNSNGQLIEPAIDALGRFIAVTAVRPGRERDVLLYDLVTGLVDPLPEVNTGEPESFPTLCAGARFMAFVRTEPSGRRLFLFDRLTRAIDSLPDLASLGPIVQGGITPDGFSIAITYVAGGALRRIAYDRRTGMIDPLPELNPVGVNGFVDLEREGLLR